MSKSATSTKRNKRSQYLRQWAENISESYSGRGFFVYSSYEGNQGWYEEVRDFWLEGNSLPICEYNASEKVLFLLMIAEAPHA